MWHCTFLPGQTGLLGNRENSYVCRSNSLFTAAWLASHLGSSCPSTFKRNENSLPIFQFTSVFVIFLSSPPPISWLDGPKLEVASFRRVFESDLGDIVF